VDCLRQSSDWENNEGIILMRPMTSGVYQHLMAEAFPEMGCGWDGAFSRGTRCPC
jgi:hypothetical protein